jgi:hypothetical protein
MKTLRASLLVSLTTLLIPLLGLPVPGALASTNNAYRSQFNGSETAATVFVPFSLAVNASGDIYVDNDEPPGTVEELSPSGTGAPLSEFKGSETPEGSFSSIAAAVNAAGDVYVADLEHGVIDEFNASGKYETQFNGELTAAKAFSPLGIAVNASGDVYVADHENDVVDEFNATGSALLAEFNGEKTAARSFAPLSVAVGPGGDVYVTSNEEEHMVVDEFNATGTELIGEIAGSETPQGSFFPYKVAIAPDGEVYVADIEHGVVDRFSAPGAYLSQFDGAATPQGAFEPAGLAVGAGGQVYVGDAASKYVDVFSAPLPVPSVTTGSASEVHQTSATLAGSIEPTGGLEATCEIRYGTEASYGSIAPCTPAGPFSAFNEVHAEISGLQPRTTYHYRLESVTENGATTGEDKSFTTLAVLPPTAEIESVTTVTAHSATLNAEVDPEGSETTYSFEDSTDGVHWHSLGQVSAGGGTEELPVAQTVGNLTGSTMYDVRLVAESHGGSVTTGEESFATLGSAPQIFGLDAADITTDQATLAAMIYPENEVTTYRFEYGLTDAYGSSVPLGEGEAGDSVASQVSETLTGLAPDTTYHFRVVATNATEPPTATSDQTFTTEAAEPLGAGYCPNESLRAESNVDPSTHEPYSSQLPDCRAYEEVTPQVKDGADIGARAGGSLSGVTAISGTGTPLIAKSPSLWGVPGAAPVETGELLTGAFYEVKREQASGWAVGPLNAPSSQLPFQQLAFVSPSDTAVDLWFGATSAQPTSAADVYRREADGQFVDVGPLGPPSTARGTLRGADLDPTPSAAYDANVEGASKNFSDVLFTIRAPQEASAPDELWPGDETTLNFQHGGAHFSLYEYSGVGHTGEGSDVPALIGVDNAGQQITQCGTAVGAAEKSGEQLEGERHNAVSDAGSTVFFNAQAGGCIPGATGPAAAQLYARIGSPGAAQATVNVAAGGGCESSASCDVTQAVTYVGASSDGSKVFFTTSQALLPGDKDATNDIYECQLPGDDGATPVPAGVVNPCPDLKAVSVSGTSSGANVRNVLAVSENGTRVYFTATGILTDVPSSQGLVADGGKENLYVANTDTGTTTFIATLQEGGVEVGHGGYPEAQVTPDGGYLVFATTADLTAGDTSTAAQVFRYDAQANDLIRISTGQDGFDSNGNTDRYPATLALMVERGGARELGTTISEDGAYVVFQSSDALTPTLKGGLNNVYEWHEGTVSLISDGIDATDDAADPYVGLVGMDATGANIFFTTKDRLVAQDTDESVDVYDARIDGGFPAPAPEPSCSGEACQGPLSSSLNAVSPLIASAGTPAIGNLAPNRKTATSNLTITKHSVRDSTIALSVSVSGPGEITAGGAGLSAGKRSVTRQGVYVLRLTLTKMTRAILRKHHKLKLEIKVAFVSSTDEAASTTLTLTLKT